MGQSDDHNMISWHALVTCLNPMARSDRDGGLGQVIAK